MNNIKYKLGEVIEFNGAIYIVASIHISLHHTGILSKKAVAKIEINLDEIEPEETADIEKVSSQEDVADIKTFNKTKVF
jgi:argininosuccinate lyase